MYRRPFGDDRLLRQRRFLCGVNASNSGTVQMKVNLRRSVRIELASCVLLLTTCAACTEGEQPAKQILNEAIQTNMDKLLADEDYD